MRKAWQRLETLPDSLLARHSGPPFHPWRAGLLPLYLFVKMLKPAKRILMRPSLPMTHVDIFAILQGFPCQRTKSSTCRVEHRVGVVKEVVDDIFDEMWA